MCLGGYGLFLDGLDGPPRRFEPQRALARRKADASNNVHRARRCPVWRVRQDAANEGATRVEGVGDVRGPVRIALEQPHLLQQGRNAR